mgnify:CR=1 FL=1
MPFEIVCKDYGYECDFVAKGEDSEYVTKLFGKHVDEEHGIWYSEESLKQMFQNHWLHKHRLQAIGICLQFYARGLWAGVCCVLFAFCFDISGFGQCVI